MNEITPQDAPPASAPAMTETPTPPPDEGSGLSHQRKRKARRRLVIIACAVVVLAAAAWYFQRSISLPLQKIQEFGNSVGNSANNQLQSFSAPSPLQQTTKAAPKKANALTDAGVVTQTNLQRAENGNVPPLVENGTLDDIATLRISDMFAGQYFAHVNSSTGESALTVASSVGYAHIALGENLALGLYAGDAGVVTAWMNSPGHRANILDAHYTQIGVAVREGTFQGQTTWIAIQIFGRPASDCPAPDANLQTTINLSENQINAMAAQLQSDKAAIAAMPSQSGPQYNEQVEDYNNLAAQYNNLVGETKTAIGAYNTEVTAFNACLAK